MEPEKIAVASNDGLNVDEHFGKATRFLIYNIGETLSFAGERPTETFSDGIPNHAFNQDRFARVADVLKDCTKVFVNQIGSEPAARLKALGIDPVIYNGPIADITV